MLFARGSNVKAGFHNNGKKGSSSQTCFKQLGVKQRMMWKHEAEQSYEKQVSQYKLWSLLAILKDDYCLKSAKKGTTAMNLLIITKKNEGVTSKMEKL